MRDEAIEAYASETSVAPGETIRFHVSVDPTEPYNIRVYRLGWYGGAGRARPVLIVTIDYHEPVAQERRRIAMRVDIGLVTAAAQRSAFGSARRERQTGTAMTTTLSR